MTGDAVGATVATLGLVLPSVIVMTLFSIFFLKFQNNKYISNAFAGLRVVVVGLILSATLLLMDKKNFIDYKSFYNICSCTGIIFKMEGKCHMADSRGCNSRDINILRSVKYIKYFLYFI